MKSYEEYEKTARAGRAFSNSTEWEMFQFNVCMGQEDSARACVNDDVDLDGGCPLILLALADKTPVEWGRAGKPRHCTEKTTAAEARRAVKRERDASDKAALEADHYPLFPEVS